MTTQTISIIRKILTVVFSLLLIGNLLFGFLLFTTVHRAPDKTTQSFWLATLTLIILIILTRKYLKNKDID